MNCPHCHIKMEPAEYEEPNHPQNILVCMKCGHYEEDKQMSKHTAGPWEQDGMEIARTDKQGVKIYHNGFHLGTWVENDWDGQSPNSNLMIAAPDLLEACKLVITSLKIVSQENLINVLNEAIQKAEDN